MPPVRISPVARAISLLFVLACKREVPAPAVTPVDEAAAAAFAAELGGALVPCDAERIAALYDYDTLGQLAIAGLRVPPQFLEGFIGGLRNSAGAKGLCGTEARPVGYRYLRLMPRDGELWPLFRIDADESINYIAFRPGRSKDGSVRIVDTYVFMTGENATTTIREMVVRMLDLSVKDVKSTTTPMERLRAAVAAGNTDEARRALADIPADMRDTKYVMMQTVSVGASGPEDEYQRAIDAYAARYPGDPSLDLVTLDGLFMKKEYPAALAALDRLDDAVGGDAALDRLGVGIAVAAGDLDRALAYGLSAVEREPTSEDMWWALLTAHLHRKDAAAALETIAELDKRFGAKVDADELSSDPMWKALIESPEWKQRKAATP